MRKVYFFRKEDRVAPSNLSNNSTFDIPKTYRLDLEGGKYDLKIIEEGILEYTKNSGEKPEEILVGFEIYKELLYLCSEQVEPNTKLNFMGFEVKLSSEINPFEYLLVGGDTIDEIIKCMEKWG